MTQKKLGVKVRALREAKGLSQHQLAKKARISQPYLSQLEVGTRGGKRPGLFVAQRLAKALGVPVTKLLE